MNKCNKPQNINKIKLELKAEHIASFKAADKNHDNLLDFNEFIEYCKIMNAYKKKRYGI